MDDKKDLPDIDDINEINYYLVSHAHKNIIKGLEASGLLTIDFKPISIEDLKQLQSLRRIHEQNKNLD